MDHREGEVVEDGRWIDGYNYQDCVQWQALVLVMLNLYILLPQCEVVVILKYKNFPDDGNLKTSKANYI
jgi:hypothetical protein